MSTDLRRTNTAVMSIAKYRVLASSAFLKTLKRQYKKAQSHRNHSKTAAIISVPTIVT